MTETLTIAKLASQTHLAPQVFDQACERLQEAHAQHTEALCALAQARCTLEFKRAELLEKGIDGKNAEARDAKLRLRLFDEHAELIGLEVALNEARKDLEQARLTWDCLRYKLRLLEVQKALAQAG